MTCGIHWSMMNFEEKTNWIQETYARYNGYEAYKGMSPLGFPVLAFYKGNRTLSPTALGDHAPVNMFTLPTGPQPLSNFWQCEFVLEKGEFGDYKWSTVEKWYQWKKACTFEDFDAASDIYITDNPKKIKAIGQKVAVAIAGPL